MEQYQEITELTPKQKKASKITAIVAITLGVVFIMLTAFLEQLPNTVRMLATTILTTLFVIFLFCGIIQKNPVSVWIAVALFVPLLIEALTINAIVAYAQIYPLYIAIPFAASLVVAIIWQNFKSHVLPLLFFGSIAAVFSLQSSGILDGVGISPWAIVLPMAGAITIGFLGFIVIKITRKN